MFNTTVRSIKRVWFSLVLLISTKSRLVCTPYAHADYGFRATYSKSVVALGSGLTCIYNCRCPYSNVESPDYQHTASSQVHCRALSCNHLFELDQAGLIVSRLKSSYFLFKIKLATVAFLFSFTQCTILSSYESLQTSKLR